LLFDELLINLGVSWEAVVEHISAAVYVEKPDASFSKVIGSRTNSSGLGSATVSLG